MAEVSAKCGGMCCEDIVLNPRDVWPLKEADLERIRVTGRLGGLGMAEDFTEWLAHLKVAARAPYGKADHFRCDLHDPETSLCTAYENRPRICSEYPYGRECEFSGCPLKFW